MGYAARVWRGKRDLPVAFILLRSSGSIIAEQCPAPGDGTARQGCRRRGDGRPWAMISPAPAGSGRSHELHVVEVEARLGATPVILQHHPGDAGIGAVQVAQGHYDPLPGVGGGWAAQVVV